MARRPITLEPEQKPANRAIVELRVEGLFGVFTYHLRLPAATADGGLAFLYGENGSGKTTLLLLLLHLLSPEPYGGHRTAISEVHFRRILVTLDDGSEVTATRNARTGPTRFVQRVTLANGETSSCMLPTLSESDTEVSDASYLRMCKLLSQLNINAYLLSHRRFLQSSTTGSTNILSNSPRKVRRVASVEGPAGTRYVLDGPPSFPNRDADSEMPLQVALFRARESIAREASVSRDSGTTRTDTIYSELVARLVRDRQPAEQLPQLNDLVADLLALAKRAASFEHYGLSPTLDVAPFVKSLDRPLTEERSVVLVEVLQPYVQSIRARLDALQGLRDTVEATVKTLRAMYLNKHVSFHLLKGFELRQHGSEAPLSPTALSSGEQQLLLLACTALACRQPGALLMIDEPEISLNVTWQRPLIGLLRTCLGKEASVLIATHSLEMMAGYSDHIVRLETTLQHGQSTKARASSRTRKS